MFVSCSKNNSDEPAEDKRIEISLRVDDFTKSGEAFRTIERNQGSDAERIIKNLYLFLFDNNGT
ncbi:major fimbrial subunit protein (FimA), partial [Porphyromonas gulae]